MSQPKGLAPILFLELWERFSYVGMRSLLMVYMVQELGFNVAKAGAIYGNYTALAYLLPVAGGFWADRQLGTRRAISLGAVLMGLGHFLMVFNATWTFYSALALLVAGTGMFKANTASLIGELYAPGDGRRDTGFNLFYLTVNVGSFAAPLVCGTLAARGQWHLGFGAAGVGMSVGLVVWTAFLPRLGAYGQPPAVRQSLEPPAPTKPLCPKERDRIRAIVILAVLGNVTLWAALGQAGSSLALFAARETNLALPFSSYEIPASWLQALNPLFILVGMPLVGPLWRRLERRGAATSPVHKFAVGLCLVAGGFLLMCRAGYWVDAGHKVGMGWLLAATLLNTTGELCVAPVGLSLVTKLSPKRFSAALMGVWYASIGAGYWAGGQLAGLYEILDKGALFAIPCAAAATVAAVFLFSARPLTRLMHGVH